MRAAFYDSEEYRKKQSEITRANLEKGIYRHLKKQEQRICIREGCETRFTARPKDPKRFCSRNCSAKVTNSRRTQSPATRQKIGAALKGKPSPFKGMIRVLRINKPCEQCGREFSSEKYKKRRFCSSACAGKRPTSPKASRGKSGVRHDISESINFHSTWEANIARMYNHLGIEWQYEPRTFNIGEHAYTPDFYLPKYSEYIEVKNFWSPYSAKRDQRFRATYPGIVLKVILKDEYRALETIYADAIPAWESSGRRAKFG